ncbi:MAG: NADH-quinone oxidoreductase subunit NuoE [Desulfobacterota bacterium]|jgi:NADH-quinone oxidoreductase subunit E|nr:NADH-quinone oxidoreductase subunit NuoE [Thermodesulfobacteriota bacterium]
MTDDRSAEELRELDACVSPFGEDRGNLIPLLQRIQEKLAYLPPEAIRRVAEHLHLTAGEVYGVATFYNQFRFHPPGKHPIKVCLGTACHVRGGEIILENFERKLGIKDGQTTEDREFSIDRVACVGCCALAPVALVEEKVQGHMAPSKVEGLILGFQLDKERQEREKAKDDSAKP